MPEIEQKNKIEILSVDLLDKKRTLVEEMRRTSEELPLKLGWHYLLDLSWAADVLNPLPGSKILDAGAGVGVMQWWLAAKGVNVLSVDRGSRAGLNPRFRSWCPVNGLRTEDLGPPSRIRAGKQALFSSLRDWLGWSPVSTNFSRPISREEFKKRGTVTIYNSDLNSMADIPDNSVDAIVSISSLEHNSIEVLPYTINELMRVLKPGGKLVATLGAAKDKDWFHEPSKGWCYTNKSLKKLFNLASDCPSNYDRYDELFEGLRNCVELRDNLADFYSRSGKNGMPWGKWDPQYHVVGVVKLKNT